MNFISRALNRWATRRFARLIAESWSVRHDSMAIATHLRDAIPVYGDNTQEFWTESICVTSPLTPCAWQHGDLTAYDLLQHAAAQAQALSFRVTHAANGAVAVVYIASIPAPGAQLVPHHALECTGYSNGRLPAPGHDQSNLTALAAAVKRLSECSDLIVSTNGSETQPNSVIN